MKSLPRLILALGLLTVLCPALLHAQSFTVGQTDGPNGYFNVLGQSFTPTVPGPYGTGTAPGSGTNVDLLSITFGAGFYAYIDSHTGPTTLYIVDMANILPGTGQLMSNAIAQAIYTNSSFTDSLSDATFGTKSRTFLFSGATLTAGTTYAALFTGEWPLVYGSSNPYSGGEMLWSSGNSQILGAASWGGGGVDVPFVASFTVTAVPEPATYAAWAGCLAMGLVFLQRHRRFGA